MSKYKFKIEGMHCSGCKNLIQMTLEEQGLTNVQINLDLSEGSFDSEESKINLESLLNNSFKELKKYSYSQLTEIN